MKPLIKLYFLSAIIVVLIPEHGIAQPLSNCAERLSELRGGFGETRNELIRIANKNRFLHQELIARQNGLLFFENEIMKLSFAISQFRGAEGNAIARRQEIQRRLNYLFSLPPHPQVLNEIDFLQNQQLGLMNNEMQFNQARHDLELRASQLKSQVEDARSLLIEKEEEFANLRQEEFALDRQLSNEIGEMNFLTSLQGQNACSESALSKAKAEIGEKQKLIKEVDALREKANLVLQKSQSSKKKIDDLLKKIEI